MNRFAPLLLALLLVGAPVFAGMFPMSWEGVLHGSGTHHASGQVVLRDGPFGALLALKQLEIDQVPDGRVILTRGGDRRLGIELGRLEQFRGETRFKVPGEIDPALFDSVVIWCEQFQVEIGRATLVESEL